VATAAPAIGALLINSRRETPDWAPLTFGLIVNLSLNWKFVDIVSTPGKESPPIGEVNRNPNESESPDVFADDSPSNEQKAQDARRCWPYPTVAKKVTPTIAFLLTFQFAFSTLSGNELDREGHELRRCANLGIGTFSYSSLSIELSVGVGLSPSLQLSLFRFRDGRVCQ
jgi:hypothetical protein